MLKTTLLGGLLSGFMVALVQSTTPSTGPASATPTFDVLSIRQLDPTQTINTPDGPRLVGSLIKPCKYLRDRVLCQLSLESLIEEAFQVKDYEIVGPDWLSNTRYVVQASMPLDTHKDTAQLMLQEGLAERFNLKFHRESREIRAYELLAGKHGVQLIPAEDAAHRKPLDVPKFMGHGAMIVEKPGLFSAAAITLDGLTANLRVFAGIDLPIINMTGLAGEYKVDLHWIPSEDPNGKDPGLRDAVERQLGLQLKSAITPINVLVIDNVDRAPDAN